MLLAIAETQALSITICNTVNCQVSGIKNLNKRILLLLNILLLLIKEFPQTHSTEFWTSNTVDVCKLKLFESPCLFNPLCDQYSISPYIINTMSSR